MCRIDDEFPLFLATAGGPEILCSNTGWISALAERKREQAGRERGNGGQISEATMASGTGLGMMSMCPMNSPRGLNYGGLYISYHLKCIELEAREFGYSTPMQSVSLFECGG